MDYYDRIKLLLKEKKDTAKNLCKHIGLPYATYITQKQRRSKNIPMTQAQKTADYLESTTEYLIMGNESMKHKPNNKTTSENIVRLIARGGKVKEFKVSDEQRKAIETLLGKDYIDPDVDI